MRQENRKNIRTSFRNRNLRSTVQLPGRIQDYCLENISSAEEEEMADGDDASETLKKMLEGLSGDKNKLTELLVKNLIESQGKKQIHGVFKTGRMSN